MNIGWDFQPVFTGSMIGAFPGYKDNQNAIGQE